MANDISNFIDENQVDDMLDASEIDRKISKLERLQSGEVTKENTMN